ncbi:MAG TPA: glucose-6-phosphate dehydrogenase assembly protein OpcA [Candidatus Lustribacter sp.]|nr:glucose-6-phosphate dehydrogenase assembly protein OpcA [Candidatus Lustribacter sp.]
MIINLPATTSAAVSKKLVTVRNDVGAMALGRVLTLIIVVDDRHADEAIEIAAEASRQHPSRIVTVVLGDKRGASRLDAQIRLGGDAGASEVVVLRLFGELAKHGQSVVVPLLLPDSPVVAWWPHTAPADLSGDPIGRMAQRRITDAAAAASPRSALRARARCYHPGDTDLAWTRITRWRGLLAAALDQPPFEPIIRAVVAGAPDSPSTDLLAGWLAHFLECPVKIVRTPGGSGISSVRLERTSGAIDLVRPGDTVATLSQQGQPDRRISLARRHMPECLADELRRLDPDEIYQAALLQGIEVVTHSRTTASQAVAAGESPSVAKAGALVRKLARDPAAKEAMAMVTAPAPQGSSEPVAIAAAQERKAADLARGTTATRSRRP